MKITKINQKGQILIPSGLRKKIGLLPGKSVRIIPEGDHLRIVPVPDDPIASSRGCLKIRKSLSREIVKEHAAERKRDRSRGAG